MLKEYVVYAHGSWLSPIWRRATCEGCPHVLPPTSPSFNFPTSHPPKKKISSPPAHLSSKLSEEDGSQRIQVGSRYKLANEESYDGSFDPEGWMAPKFVTPCDMKDIETIKDWCLHWCIQTCLWGVIAPHKKFLSCNQNAPKFTAFLHSISFNSVQESQHLCPHNLPQFNKVWWRPVVSFLTDTFSILTINESRASYDRTRQCQCKQWQKDFQHAVKMAVLNTLEPLNPLS